MDIQNKIEEMKVYRTSSSVSQSLLTALSRSPSNIRLSNRETNYFTLGSLVDTMAFFGEEGTKELYAVTTIKKPEGLIWEYHLLLLEAMTIDGMTIAHAKDLAYKHSGFKIARPTVEARYEKEVIPYLKEELANDGKIIVNAKDYNHAKVLVKALKEDKYTAPYFKDTNMFQTSIQEELCNLPCKGLLDIIDIDEENKTMRVVDLKTTSKPIYNFQKSILDYRYDIQLAFYTDLLKKSPISKGYGILNPRFVVINTDAMEPPIVFELSDRDLQVARNGGKSYDGKTIKGYKELIKQYINSSSNSPYFKDYEDNGGVMKLDIYAGNLEVR